jgi:hypothetical protein
VGGCGPDGAIANFSNTGLGIITCLAPAVDITTISVPTTAGRIDGSNVLHSSMLNNGCGENVIVGGLCGTAFAAAHVTACIALHLYLFPSATKDSLMHSIMSTTANDGYKRLDFKLNLQGLSDEFDTVSRTLPLTVFNLDRHVLRQRGGHIPSESSLFLSSPGTSSETVSMMELSEGAAVRIDYDLSFIINQQYLGWPALGGGNVDFLKNVAANSSKMIDQMRVLRKIVEDSDGNYFRVEISPNGYRQTFVANDILVFPFEGKVGHTLLMVEEMLMEDPDFQDIFFSFSRTKTFFAVTFDVNGSHRYHFLLGLYDKLFSRLSTFPGVESCGGNSMMEACSIVP